MDFLSPAERSRVMARVKSKDTTPEIVVRRLLHSMGFRFRLHTRNLPGTPDIVLPRHRKVVFVNGCFWHRHKGCKRASMPKSNVPFWRSKLRKNVRRQSLDIGELERMGWKVKIVWECDTRDPGALSRDLGQFLHRSKRAAYLPMKHNE